MVLHPAPLIGRRIRGLQGSFPLEQSPRNVTAPRETLERARAEERQNYQVRQHWALLLALEDKKIEASQEMDAGLQTYAEIQVFGPASAADFYAVMGDADKALEWLDRAVRMGDEREEYLRRNPLLTNLRQHPRFRQILDAVVYRRKQRPAVDPKTRSDASDDIFLGLIRTRAVYLRHGRSHRAQIRRDLATVVHDVE